jgi:hypothetical protein
MSCRYHPTHDHSEDSMSKQHTPGPWTAHGPSPWGAADENRGCLSRGEYIVFPLPEDDEIEANARLIAAAPDLLHALKWAADYVSQGWLREFLKKTITKAEG